MGIKVPHSGILSDLSVMKRWNGTAWIDCEYARVYENGAWVDKWIAFPTGTYQEFSYAGVIQTYTVPATGWYKLETYGAQGGDGAYTYFNGGKGGYTVGYKILTKGTVLYICVGGKGSTTSGESNHTAYGGYNGGGHGRAASGAIHSGGGGLTHIAKVTGILSAIGYTSAITNGNLLLCSGGGGGNGERGSGGAGGGLTGGAGTGEYANGATQTASGWDATSCGFGYGNATTPWANSGGSGGGLYGGGAYHYIAGGGGSGYYGNVSDYSASILKSMSTGVRSGNGFAKITAYAKA